MYTGLAAERQAPYAGVQGGMVDLACLGWLNAGPRRGIYDATMRPAGAIAARAALSAPGGVLIQSAAYSRNDRWHELESYERGG